MSSGAQLSDAGGACLECLRRAWLLDTLSGPLDYCSRDRERLIEALALRDEALLSALAGRRRGELRVRYDALTAGELSRVSTIERLCCHHSNFPGALSGSSAPRMLNVIGSAERLRGLTAAPVVAIVGSRRASDYGMEVARSLGRGLTASGVTVTSVLSDGISAGALAGALEVGGGAVAVMGSGLAVPCAASRRSLYERLTHRGCAISELPDGCRGRRWGALAGERIVVGLAKLVIVVEAEQCAEDLFVARLAQTMGHTLAAIPGRVSSPLSRGTHALLMEGADLLRGAADALELLHTIGTPGAHLQPLTPARPAVGTRLTAMLERVGRGCDTPEKLIGEGMDRGETLMALSELELTGLLSRGDGGRYLVREPLPEEHHLGMRELGQTVGTRGLAEVNAICCDEQINSQPDQAKAGTDPDSHSG